MWHLLTGYLRVTLFAICLLMGIQVPGFLNQYQQRIDAHYLEAANNLSGFQATANVYFDGDLTALIAYYESSNDPVFRSDADSIRNIYSRYLLLTAERQAMEGNWYRRASHLVLDADDELVQETWQAYSYTVPLNQNALEWGFALAISITLVIELLCRGTVRLCSGLVSPRPRRSRAR